MNYPRIKLHSIGKVLDVDSSARYQKNSRRRKNFGRDTVPRSLLQFKSRRRERECALKIASKSDFSRPNQEIIDEQQVHSRYIHSSRHPAPCLQRPSQHNSH
ncbi:hypothetical protein KM043_001279 [Ampulex compressa]|nr:hypothetical protein KM043_001279 [Ampulex compressa]